MGLQSIRTPEGPEVGREITNQSLVITLRERCRHSAQTNARRALPSQLQAEPGELIGALVEEIRLRFA